MLKFKCLILNIIIKTSVVFIREFSCSVDNSNHTSVLGINVDQSVVHWDFWVFHSHCLDFTFVVILFCLQKSKVDWDTWVFHQHTLHLLGIVVSGLQLYKVGV